jgi:hypothetical protein
VNEIYDLIRECYGLVTDGQIVAKYNQLLDYVKDLHNGNKHDVKEYLLSLKALNMSKAKMGF